MREGLLRKEDLLALRGWITNAGSCVEAMKQRLRSRSVCFVGGMREFVWIGIQE